MRYKNTQILCAFAIHITWFLVLTQNICVYPVPDKRIRFDILYRISRLMWEHRGSKYASFKYLLPRFNSVLMKWRWCKDKMRWRIYAKWEEKKKTAAQKYINILFRGNTIYTHTHTTRLSCQVWTCATYGAQLACCWDNACFCTKYSNDYPSYNEQQTDNYAHSTRNTSCFYILKFLQRFSLAFHGFHHRLTTDAHIE